MRPYVSYISSLLESGVEVLIYAGDSDWASNWIGSKEWVEKLEWSGQKTFNNSPDRHVVSMKTSKDAGEIKGTGNLFFIKIYEAGHMVCSYVVLIRF